MTKMRSAFVTTSLSALTGRLAVLLLSVALCSLSFAQTQALSFREAIDMALRQNEKCEMADLEVQRQAELKKAMREMPKTDVTLLYGQYNSIADRDNNFTFSQEIPFPGVLGPGSRLGDARIAGSLLDASLTDNELTFAVRRTYVTLQYFAARRALLQEQERFFAALSDTSAGSPSGIKAGSTGAWAAVIILDDIRNELRRNEADYAIFLLELQELTGSEVPVSITEEKLEVRTPVITDSTGLSNNPAFLKKQLQLEITDSEKEVIVAEAMPDFRLGYFNQSLIGTQDVNGEDVYFDAATRFQGIQLGISVPLFFGAHIAKARAAEIKKEIAETDLEDYQAELQKEYGQALQELKKNSESLAYFAETALPHASKLSTIAQAAYTKGELPLTDYLVQLEHVTVVQEKYLNALFLYDLSVFRLQFLLGE